LLESALKEHIEFIHNGKRMFSCEICERDFGYKVEYGRKVNVHFMAPSPG
jgi:hypothetical protein